jgi:formylmethanofuran dehydrogenase subunit E
MNLILWLLLVLFVALLVIAGIIYVKYKQQIKTAWLMFSTFRKMKKNAKPQGKDIPEKAISSDSPLVRCSKCQKWTPQDGAVKLKSNYFCSHSCMEQSFARN